MKGNGKNAGALAAMVKGEKPYDQATVDAALAQFEDTAKKLPTLFPASIKGLKAERRLQFLAEGLGRQGRLRRAYRKLRQGRHRRQGKIKDLDSLKARSRPIGKECGGCHETYRVKNS